MAMSVDRIQGLSGGLAIKAPVKAVSVANITLSGEQTVNSVAVVAGDRVLVAAQTDATENGIRDVSTGTWTRAKDCNGPNDLVQGTIIPVAALADTTLYRVDTANPIVIGTTALTISALALGNAGLTAAIEVSVAAAQLAETNAETAETNAAGSAAAASVSAAAGSGSAAAASGSADAASSSAGAASSSASAASGSASAASSSASAASGSAAAAAAIYDAFDDRYLGAKASNPTLDNDGNALVTGALYWNTSNNTMRTWSGSAWDATYSPSPGVSSVGAATPVVSSGGTTPDISLAAGYGDTQNPYAEKARYYVLAAPFTFGGGLPSFRALIAADIPTLNQDTTGSAGRAGVPRWVVSVDYTLIIDDANVCLLHPSTDTTPRTFTIPSNASVAFPVGTTITVVNQNGAGDITIAITTDTMRLAGQGTLGSRLLVANGIATALKVSTTDWIISGVGLT